MQGQREHKRQPGFVVLKLTIPRRDARGRKALSREARYCHA